MTITKTKHTPGPWESGYIFQASTNEVKANGNRIAIVLQYDDRQKMVADYETCEANAKLIAAAPELLEALISHEMSMCLIEFSAYDKKSNGYKAYEKIMSAIKKATE